MWYKKKENVILRKHKKITRNQREIGSFDMREKGIMLIALVITIIILLILASVTVATLTGDNGIITKAMEARQKTEEAELDEQLKLARVKCEIKQTRRICHIR